MPEYARTGQASTETVPLVNIVVVKGKEVLEKGVDKFSSLCNVLWDIDPYYIIKVVAENDDEFNKLEGLNLPKKGDKVFVDLLREKELAQYQNQVFETFGDFQIQYGKSIPERDIAYRDRISSI